MTDDEELEAVEEELLAEAQSEEEKAMKVTNRSIFTIKDQIVKRAQSSQKTDDSRKTD